MRLPEGVRRLQQHPAAELPAAGDHRRQLQSAELQLLPVQGDHHTQVRPDRAHLQCNERLRLLWPADARLVHVVPDEQAVRLHDVLLRRQHVRGPADLVRRLRDPAERHTDLVEDRNGPGAGAAGTVPDNGQLPEAGEQSARFRFINIMRPECVMSVSVCVFWNLNQ